MGPVSALNATIQKGVTDALKHRDATDFEGTESCANCAHCRVTGDPGNPTVYCDRGHGKALPLVQMFKRPDRPLGFRQAGKCPDRDFMDDSKKRSHKRQAKPGERSERKVA